MVEKQLESLISELIEGSLDESGVLELQRLLKSNPDAIDVYLDQLEINALLSDAGIDTPLRTKNPNLFPSSDASAWSNVHLPTNWLVLLFAGLAICLGWYYLAGGNDKSNAVSSPRPGNTSLLTSQEILPSRVARITNGRDMQWKDANFRIGNWLSSERYELISGAVEVTFDSGTIIAIAGPTEFDLVSANHTVLHRGSLTADVPKQAVGFRVATPSGEIVDLSTKFSLTVGEDGQSDVTVIDGLVEAVSVGNKKGDEEYSIPFGEKTSIKLVSNELPKEIPYSQPKVVQFAATNNANSLNFIHYSFDDDSFAGGVISNHGSKDQPDGRLITPQTKKQSGVVRTNGQFGKALYFAGTGGSIETLVAGVSGNKPRTVAFWVKILPGTHKQYAYAFVGWGKPADKSGKKWQVSWNANNTKGRRGAIRTEFGGGHVTGSTDLRDGKWHHVASVYLGDTSSGLLDNVKHYVDGKLEHFSHLVEVNVDTSSEYRSMLLGDKVEHATNFFKGYKGWMDEFYVFDAALTPSQIVSLMERNAPPESTSIIDSYFEFAKP